MKLLAIVTDELKKLLIHNFGCEIDFHSSWQQADANKMAEYGYVIAMGSLIEEQNNPIVLWGICSEIRYFNIQALFVDVSFQAANLIPAIYPQIKLISYNRDSNQFMLHLRTYAPQLFFDDPKFRNSSLSAAANARRYEDKSSSSSIAKKLTGVSGYRNQSSSDMHILQPSAVTGSFSPISSIPLGKNSTSQDAVLKSQSFISTPMPNFRKDGMGNGRPDDLCDLDALIDVSSISGVSAISSIENALEENSSSHHTPKSIPIRTISGVSHTRQISSGNSRAISQSAAKSIVRVITRSPKDIQMGLVEFGNLIRVMQTIARLQLTGILEVSNDTRNVRVEFRQGTPYTTCSPSLVLSALGWTSGEYSFDSGKLLPANAQPIDLHLLFSSAAQEQLPLNPLLQALETEFNSYVILTSVFDPANHPDNTGKWWNKCNGNTRFSEIMMSSGLSMDAISRDIFLAWLCDEICFLKTPCSDKIHIEYQVAKPRINVHDRPASCDDFNDISNHQASQINAIKSQLAQLRDAFSKQSGYALLGLKQGCGIKALDAAYYAWISRYHADRFVRYNDAECLKLANELLMLMNAAYAKLSKIERNNASERLNSQELLSVSMASEPARERTIDVSPRIGAGRARINTLASASSSDSGNRLRTISSELKAIQNNEIHHAHEVPPPSIANRAPIRPASAMNEQNAHPGQQATNPEPKVLKMSDILAKRQAARQQRQAEPVPETEPATTQSRSYSWTSANVTPEQHFNTAQKKLKLGLSQEALTAIEWALKSDPDNPLYIAYRAYAGFLVNPSTRDEAIDIIGHSVSKLRDMSFMDPKLKASLFAPLYFLGKLYIAAENYDKANGVLQAASKIDAADVDTMRSLRYVSMQIDKRNAASANKGFLSRLKDRLNK